MFSGRKRNYLILLFLAAFLARLSAAFLWPHMPQPDEASWIAAGSALSQGQGFVNHLRHPGYVLFLGAAFTAFGDGNEAAVKTLQSLLGALQVVLLFFIAWFLFRDETVSWLSAGFLAFYPYHVFYVGNLLSEPLYSFLLTAALLFLFALPEGKRTAALAVMGGAAFGFAALTKSTVLVASPFIIAWLVLNRVKPRAMMLFFGAALLLVLPFTARNYVKYHAFIPVNPSGPFFFEANNPETLRLEKETRQLKEVQWYTEEYREIARLPVPEADREYRKRALSFIRHNPGTVLKLMKMRLVHFWRLYPITNSAAQRWAALLTSGLLLPLAVLGIFLSARAWRKTLLPVALILSFNAVHLVFICTLRYRIPLDPFFLPFAAYALIRIFPGKGNGPQPA